MRYEFLPPYSPDFNPIELAFSFMKYSLRRNGDYIRFALTELPRAEIGLVMLETLYAITPQHAFGWFRHCGYV
jgi:transposase